MRSSLVAASAIWFALPLLSYADSGPHPEAAATLPLSLILLGSAVLGLMVGGALYLRKRTLVLPVVAGLAALLLTGGVLLGFAPAPREAGSYPALAGVHMEIYKSPGCTCCGGFITELEAQGAAVAVREVSDEALAAFKREHGIGQNLESCHTTLVDGYVVEGHVPFAALAKLLAERPAIKGIALPGMPSGTPGMPGPKRESYRIQALSGEEYLVL